MLNFFNDLALINLVSSNTQFDNFRCNNTINLPNRISIGLNAMQCNDVVEMVNFDHQIL